MGHCVTSVDTESEVLQLFAQRRAVRGGWWWCRDAAALCEPEVVVKRRVAPSSFLSTEKDLQAAL